MLPEVWIRANPTGDPMCGAVWVHLGDRTTLIIREGGQYDVYRNDWGKYTFNLDPSGAHGLVRIS